MHTLPENSSRNGVCVYVARLLLSYNTDHVRVLANGLKPVDCFTELKFDHHN